MPSTKIDVLRVPTGGVDRSQQSFLLAQQTAYQIALNQTGFKQESFYTLLNFRPYRSQLVQIPPMTALFSLTGFMGFGAPGQVRLMVQILDNTGTLQYFILDEVTARFVLPTNTATQTQINFVLQTAIPADTTINGQVLLYGINTTDFANLNDEIDIVIVDSTHFKWRKNSGAYSGSIVIAPTVALSGTSLTVAFQATSGYTAAETWSWKLTTTPYAATYPSFGVTQATYQSDVYIAGYDRNVLRLRNNVLTTVGYQRVYGKYVVEFYNHLMVGHYAEAISSGGAAVDGFNSATTPWTVGWSDLNNPDNFFGTLINEADQFQIPSRSNDDTLALGITGVGKFLNIVYFFVSKNIWSCSYVGLPNVMQFDELNLGVGSIFQNGVVSAHDGIYFIAEDNFYQFNGSSVTKIGFPVRDQFFAEVAPVGDSYRQQLYGAYDGEKAEVVWSYWMPQGGGYYQGRQVIYRTDTQLWYFRNVPSVSSVNTDIRAFCPQVGSFSSLLYGGNGEVLYDASVASGAYTPFDLIDGTPFLMINGSIFTLIPSVVLLNDAVDGSGNQTLTQPTIVTQDLVYDDVFYQKEAETIFIDAQYTICSGVQVSYSARPYLSQPPSFTAIPELWAQNLPEGRLGLPRVSGSVFTFMFVFTGLTGVIGAVFSGWSEFIYGRKQQVEK